MTVDTSIRQRNSKTFIDMNKNKYEILQISGNLVSLFAQNYLYEKAKNQRLKQSTKTKVNQTFTL